MGVIAAIYKGTGMGGLQRYLFEEGKGPDGGRPRVLDLSFVEGDSAAELTRSFGVYRRIAGEGKDVWDVAFSWRREEAPARAVRVAYVQDWKHRMGLEDCPSVLVEHQDAPVNINDHLALLAVDGKGRRVHQAFDWNRSNKICGELDLKYGLTPENRTKRLEDPELDPFKVMGKRDLAALHFQGALARAKAAGNTWKALAGELLRGGYELYVVIHQKGKLQGLVKGIGARSLTDQRASFDGSALSRKWSYQGLLKHYGIEGDIREIAHEHAPSILLADAREIGVGATGSEPGSRDHSSGLSGREAPYLPHLPVVAARAAGRAGGGRAREAASAIPGSHRERSRGEVAGGSGGPRHGRGRRPGGRLFPGAGGVLAGVGAAGGTLVGGPRVVVPTLQRSEVLPLGLGHRLPGSGGPGAVPPSPQAGGGLASGHLPLGDSRPARAEAGDPPLGDHVRRDSHLGGGADVVDPAAGTVGEPGVSSGGGGSARARKGPGAGGASSAAAGHGPGGGTDGPGADAASGSADVAPEVRPPGGGGLELDLVILALDETKRQLESMSEKTASTRIHHPLKADVGQERPVSGPSPETSENKPALTDPSADKGGGWGRGSGI